MGYIDSLVLIFRPEFPCLAYGETRVSPKSEVQQTWKYIGGSPVVYKLETCCTRLPGCVCHWLGRYFHLSRFLNDASSLRLSQGQIKLLTYTFASSGEMMRELMLVISLLSNDDDRALGSPSSILGTLLN